MPPPSPTRAARALKLPGALRAGAQRRALAAIGAALLAMAGFPAPLRAQPEPEPAPGPASPIRVILDSALGETRARVVRIDGTTITWVLPADAARSAPVTRPLSGVVALLTPDPVRPPRRDDSDARPVLGVLLTDGERLVARLARDAEGAGPAGAEAPVWFDTALGIARVPLDAIATISVGDPPEAGAPAPRTDTVTLANGDRLEGFVESVGAEVSIKPDQGDPVRLPLDRVRSIALANPRTPPRGTLAWLSDGSVVRITDLAQGPDEAPHARVAVLGSDAPAPLPGLVSLVFDAARLAPLATLAVVEVSPAPERRWTRPPRALPGPAPLDAPDLEIPGPLTCEFALPTGARRLSGSAELARYADNWGDCTLTLELSGAGATRRVWSQRLAGAGQSAAFSVDLGPPGAGRRLRLTLDPGERGSIQDRVILRRPLVLLDAD